MQLQHNKTIMMGGLGALVGCLLAAAGCASDQEARRGETTTAAEAREHRREVRRDRDRDRDGVRDDREVAARDAELDDSVAVKPVTIANASDVRDNVGEREAVRDNVNDRDRDGVVDGKGVDRDRDGVVDSTERGKPVDDRALTSRIRKSITDDDELSTKAKNVEIISKNGAVTLRGPVATAAEKSRVVSHAEKQVGAKNVTNEIEVLR